MPLGPIGPDEIDGQDRLQTTSAESRQDRSPSVDTLTDYVSENLLPDTDRTYLLSNRGSIIDYSGVESVATRAVVGSEVPSRVVGVGVFASSASRLTVGSVVRGSFFANSQVVRGARILFQNHTQELSFFTSIDQLDANSGDITLETALPSALQEAAASSGDGANTLTVFSATNLVVDGDLTINGDILGNRSLARQLVNTNTAAGAIQPQAYWLGTEAEFQALSSAGLVDANTMYDTY